MSSEEIGFADLRKLVRREWKLIVGLAALLGVATLVAVAFLLPDVYEATARLIVHPSASGRTSRSVELYRSLLESDGILKRASDRLIENGLLEEGGGLRLGRDVSVDTVTADRGEGPVGSSFVTVTGSGATAEKAAAIANTMAEVFIADSRSMLRSAAAQSETVLGGQLSPTREQLQVLEADRRAMLDGFQEREETTSTEWDRRISEAKKKAEGSTAAYRSKTRRQMEEAVERHTLAWPNEAPAVTARAKLLEIVSVRAQLAQTPRVLTLEKAISDETLAELIVEAKEVELFDTTLTSQEANRLYDQLALKALALESEIERSSHAQALEVASLLTRLEEIQLERAAGLTVFLDGASLELRTLRRRRSRALEDIAREREAALAESDRSIAQLTGLEISLAEGLNEAVVTRLLEEAKLVDLAAPAVPHRFAEPRDVPVKVAAAAFLGAMLGLMLALFRSSGNS